MRAHAAPSPASPSRFQGFGPFGSLVTVAAVALATFCVILFLSIFGLLAFNTLGHHHADYALTYRYIAGPAALAAGFATAATLTVLALARRLRS